MIVPMKHVTVIVRSEDTADAVQHLAALGTLHLDMDHPESDPSELRAEVNKFAQAVRQLDRLPKVEQRESVDCAAAIAGEILTLREQISEGQKEGRTLATTIQQYSPLGDFDPAALQALAPSAGVHVRLYSGDEKQLAEIPSEVPIQIIGREKRTVYVATIQRGEPATLPLNELELPSASLSSLRDNLADMERQIEAARARMSELAALRDQLEKAWLVAEDRLKLALVAMAMPEKSVVRYLHGFIPFDQVEAVQSAATEHGWAIVVDDPYEHHEPPTLIRNPAWLDGIGAVFKMINVFPGYAEVDISRSFMLFLTLFFAILIGDAGYGVLIMVMCAGLYIKLKTPPRELLNLGFVFGIVTVIWGAITGNWFGSSGLRALPWVDSMTIASLDVFSLEQDSTGPMMEICFIIGATHLSLAHALAAMRMSNSLRALGELGWMLFVWGMYFVVRLMVMDAPLPDPARWLMVGGASFILLFTAPSKNIFKTIGLGLAELLGKVIACFADIVSYIRLFAAGMATFAIAASFNEIAAGLGKGAVAAGAAVLILVVGHAVNMILAALAVVVHGVRLNLLEYSGHVGIQWSGSEYAPLTITSGEGESQ